MLINIALDRRAARTTFVIAVLCLAAFIAAETMHFAIVAALDESNDVRLVRIALRLNAENYRVQHNLGSLYFWSNVDAEHALPLLKTAAQLNPYNPEYQQDLGTVCQALGDIHCADEAFVAAARLAPRSPRFQLARANHFLVTSRPSEALMGLHDYVELRPDDPKAALGPFLRGIADADGLWNALPQTLDYESQLALISLLSNAGKFELANRYWRELVRSEARIALPVSVPYLNTLQNRGQLEQLVDVWRDLQHMGSVPAQEEHNLVFNGGFESAPTNVGLDWHYQQHSFVQLHFSDSTAGTGTRSLRADFTSSSNEDLDLLEQIVPVAKPGTYVLTAFVRSRAITSDCGPRLRIQDFLCATCLDASTQGTVGTSDLHQVSTSFTIAPGTRFLRVSLHRPRCRAYPMEITGQFWIDGIIMQRLSQ